MSAPRDLWLSPSGLARLAAGERLAPCLIRWHEGRCRAPAQDCRGLMAGMKSAGWTIRDVSCGSTPDRERMAAKCALDRGGDVRTCGCPSCRGVFE